MLFTSPSNADGCFAHQNGNITDPPAASTSSETLTRFAHAPTQSGSPPARPSTTTSPFCDVCLKNQHIVATALRDFSFPASAVSNATPAALDAAYNSHHKALEARYPPVCGTCAPRVREQLKRAAYTAKTDHLRRMVEKTRANVAWRKPAGGWGYGIVELGRLVWNGSALAQVLLHTLALVAAFYDAVDQEDDRGLGNQPTFLACCLGFRTEGIARSCAETAMDRWMPTVLVAAFLSMWWHNQLLERYFGRGGRLKGLGEYYAVQLFSIIVRLAGHLYLTRLGSSSSEGKTRQALHIFMVIFIPIVSLPARIFEEQQTDQIRHSFYPRASSHSTKAPAYLSISTMPTS